MGDPIPRGGRSELARSGDAIPIGVLVDNFLKSPAHRQRRALYEEVGGLLREAMGPLAADLQPLSLRDGCLTLGVRSAALLHEIHAFRKHALLEFLKARMGPKKLRDIRFRHTEI